jgi:hypothetical protein
MATILTAGRNDPCVAFAGVHERWRVRRHSRTHHDDGRRPDAIEIVSAGPRVNAERDQFCERPGVHSAGVGRVDARAGATEQR